MGPEVDIDDIFAQMFGMGGMGGMGGMPGMGGMGGMPHRPGKPKKGRNEEQQYEVSLEDLYKGKTTRFASTKNIVCPTCKGTGGKEKAKSHQCGICHGKGLKSKLLRPNVPLIMFPRCHRGPANSRAWPGHSGDRHVRYLQRLGQRVQGQG
jgi:DnaJ-class molecular chaperone